MRLLSILIILNICSCFQGQTIKEEVKLDLSGEHLKSVPDSVFKMKEVTFLDLGSSSIAFYPPLSALVDSNTNELEDLPDEIAELTNLKTLILNSNKLKSLPSSITKLRNLEVLDLSINRDLDIAQELNKLKALPNLKILKIVDVKLDKDDLELIKTSLGADTKVIVTINEYLETIN